MKDHNFYFEIYREETAFVYDLHSPPYNLTNEERQAWEERADAALSDAMWEDLKIMKKGNCQT